MLGLRGEPVAVIRPVDAYDESRDRVRTWGAPETVNDVLVAPSSTEDVAGSARDGDRLVLQLCFPQGFTESLRGCRIEVRGELFDVLGDPRQQERWNCPTRWGMVAEARRVQG